MVKEKAPVEGLFLLIMFYLLWFNVRGVQR